MANVTWDAAVTDYLGSLNASTAGQYCLALTDFAAWYAQTYGEAPSPTLLTDKEVQEYRGYLSGLCNLKAASVNVRLSALKGLVRSLGRELQVKGVRKMETHEWGRRDCPAATSRWWR